jgi:hypothetical protein
MCIVRGLADLALGSLVACGLGGLEPRAYADPVSDPKIARADQLFAEGKALFESNLLEACKKFDESLRENPAAIGTLLNVALCDEKLGKVATAVARFSEARVRAKEQGLPEHIRAAEEHIAALTPSIPHVTIKLTEALPETKILLDDTLLALDATANVPVDPGDRVIVVSAPARLPYRANIVIGTGEHQDVVIPALARSVTIKSSQLLLGQIATLGGAAAAGAGLGIGLYARHLYRQPFDDGRCTSDPDKGNRCSPDGQKQTNRAHTYGNIGTVVGVAGVLVAGAGAYLWFRSPKSTPPDTGAPKLTVVPQVSPDGLGVFAVGRF